MNRRELIKSLAAIAAVPKNAIMEPFRPKPVIMAWTYRYPYKVRHEPISDALLLKLAINIYRETPPSV